MSNIDETALNVLMAEGIDPSTALEGSVLDEPRPRRATGTTAVAVAIGFVWIIYRMVT